MISTAFSRLCYAPVLLACLLLLTPASTTVAAPAGSANAFPSYRSISSNVTFWEKIYGYYSINEAVIHDRQDLAKIYRVLPLIAQGRPDAERRNAMLREEALATYRTMLDKLSREPPRSPEEKRIAALFPGAGGRKQMAAAAENIRIQTGLRERFLEGVVQSGAYMPEIKRTLARYGLPEELAYLPHVESSFNLNAHSRLGAAGIWQFTLATGKEYMVINDILDERRDPFIATIAAAKYLQKSYRALNSWPLAITSYNYGLAGTLRAVREMGGYEQIFKGYHKGHFKFAARNFYPEFLAALKVARQLEQNPSIRRQAPVAYRYVSLPGYVDAAALSRYLGLGVDVLRTHNPALRPVVFSGEKLIPRGYALRLPADRIKPELLAAFPAGLTHHNQLATMYHRVRPGDTAGTIAKRHGVSLKNLVEANRLDASAKVVVGQQLRIPKASGPARVGSSPGLAAQSKRPAAIAAEVPILAGTKKQRPLQATALTLPVKDRERFAVKDIHRKNGRQYGSISVQAEESLALYAAWLGTSVNNLRAINRLSDDAAVFPGQKVLLAFDHQPAALFEQRRLDHLQHTENAFLSSYAVVGKKVYRVNHGDTLWDLCHNKFAIPLWLLERYNSALDLSRLSTEQELTIPVVQPI